MCATEMRVRPTELRLPEAAPSFKSVASLRRLSPSETEAERSRMVCAPCERQAQLERVRDGLNLGKARNAYCRSR
jgi:hypothetical protein